MEQFQRHQTEMLVNQFVPFLAEARLRLEQLGACSW